MDAREFALVAFTILAQMSVGSFVVLGVVQLLGRRAGHSVDRLTDAALYAIGPVLVLAFVASLFHLGNPVNAIRAVGNLDSSWLSREIFFGAAFAAMGAVFAAAQKLKWGAPLLRQLFAGATAIVGLIFVFAMSQVYMLPTVPVWNSWATPVSFFTTTFLLGVLAVGAAFVGVSRYRRTRYGDETGELAVLLRGSIRGIAVAAVVLLGVEFVVLPTYLAQLAAEGGAAANALAGIVSSYGVLLVLRLLLVFLGAGVLGFFLYRFAARPGRETLMGAVAVAVFVLVFSSELIGRILFYSSYLNVGL